MADSYMAKSKCPKSDTFVPHSIPVPDLFRHAKNILKQHMEGRGTVKKLVFEGRYRNYQKLFAVVIKAAEQFDKIQNVLKDLGIFANHPQLDPYLATILASQIVERGKDIPGQAKPILAMNSYKCKLLIDLNKVEDMSKTGDVLPTYVRINLLKTTPEVIHEELRNYGFFLQDHDWSKLSYKDFLDIVNSLTKDTYITDYHVPDLLVFPPRQAFWYRQIFTESLIIVQDKASCLPAFLSGVQPGMNVIDACAAPGNKTTHLASLMKMQGTLTAVERDFKRYETLKKLINERGATFINAVNSDFTNIDSKLFENTDAILVDPSCSSSGTGAHNEDVSIQRVESLAFFQTRILEHALSFPNVQTVLYSTCSVNDQENEAVVEAALKKFGQYFKLSKLQKHLKGWQHFGSPNYDCGKYCIRTDKSSDKCHGFFVAKFIRRRNPKIQDITVNSSLNTSCNMDVMEESKSLSIKHKSKKHSQVDNICESLQYEEQPSGKNDSYAPDDKNSKKKSKKNIYKKNDMLIEPPQKKKRKNRCKD